MIFDWYLRLQQAKGTPMKYLRCCFVAFMFFLFSCTTSERNNPFDPENPEYSAPVIVVPAKDQLAIIGQPVRFEVFASGTELKTYQWNKDGKDLTGETESIYTIHSVKISDEGIYECVVRNRKGIVRSSAKLTVKKQ